MKYLYVYKRGACNIEIREESEIKVHPGKFGIFKPIARIPVEDLQAEQKQEEIKEEVSDIDKQIKELKDKRKKLIEGLYEI